MMRQQKQTNFNFNLSFYLTSAVYVRCHFDIRCSKMTRFKCDMRNLKIASAFLKNEYGV